MGLLQKAVETYDANRALAGVQREGHQALAPVGHNLAQTNLEIALQENGNFHSDVAVDKSEPKIILPVTEESAGRTSTACRPHPLCDQLGYLAPYNRKKHEQYVKQLTDWTESEYSQPMLRPILTYVKGGTILQDLNALELITLTDSGIPTDEKLLVRWRVVGMGLASGGCWTDMALFQAFTAWYENKRASAPPQLCMIEGKQAIPAQQHLKGIIPFNGNAKLISANDTSGFTYRGRFTSAEQAATVSYEVSQKAHNALRWVAAEQGAQAVYGGRTFLCWNPQGRRVCSPVTSLLPNAEPGAAPQSYRERLRRTVAGMKSELPEDKGGVVIAVFDAATTGRLALTYYNELRGSDFLDRRHHWDAHCCWYHWKQGNFGIYSPPLKLIVRCAFGAQQEVKGKNKGKRKKVLVADDEVMRQQLQRLLACRVNRTRMPVDIEQALVRRASNPMANDGGVYAEILFVACAVIKKYHDDRNQNEEGYEMAQIAEKKDRSYQFGRLLAVFEKVERDTYDREETRTPEAIRLQSIFCQRPMYTANILEKDLNRSYFRKLRQANPRREMFYRNLISDILRIIHDEFPEAQWNAPLQDHYLMGYYQQRQELYTNHKQEPDPAGTSEKQKNEEEQP